MWLEERFTKIIYTKGKDEFRKVMKKLEELNYIWMEGESAVEFEPYEFNTYSEVGYVKISLDEKEKKISAEVLEDGREILTFENFMKEV